MPRKNYYDSFCMDTVKKHCNLAALPPSKNSYLPNKKLNPYIGKDEDFVWRRHVKHKHKYKTKMKALLSLECADAMRDEWLRKRIRGNDFQFSKAQLKILRDWFNQLDTDGSCEISASELEDTLLSIGAANNLTQVQALLLDVDSDRSGTIGFREFIAIFNPNGKKNNYSAFSKLQDQMIEQENGGVSVNTRISSQRRTFITNALLNTFDTTDIADNTLKHRENKALEGKNIVLANKIAKQRTLHSQQVSSTTERFSSLISVIQRNCDSQRTIQVSEPNRKINRRHGIQFQTSLQNHLLPQPFPSPEIIQDAKTLRKLRLHQKQKTRNTSPSFK